MSGRRTMNRVRRVVCNRVACAAAAVAAVLCGAAPRAMGLQNTQPAAPAATTVPAAAPAAGTQSLKVVVVEVTGKVAASTDGKKWVEAKVGMELGEGAQFRTGIKSSVTCIIPPDQTFKLESVGTIRVAEAVKSGTKARTDLIMKYGAASYGIEAGGQEHDATIRTPSSTLAVRGTVVRVYDQPPFAPTAESFTGQAFYRTAQRQTKVGGKSYAAVSSANGTAADTAVSKSTVDPNTARARTASEARYVADQVSRGAVFTFDTQTMIPTLRNGPGPVSDAELANSLPGRLAFSLRWSGNANLNFLVSDQAGDQLALISKFNPQEILFPGFGLNQSNSGGLIPFDDRGGQRGGMEIAFWQDAFPQGIYGVGALHAGGGQTEFRINGFLDKKPLNFIFLDANQNLVKTQTFKGTIQANVLPPPEERAAIVFVPPNPIEDFLPDAGGTETQAIVRRALAQLDKQLAADAVAGKASQAEVVNLTGLFARPLTPAEAAKAEALKQQLAAAKQARGAKPAAPAAGARADGAVRFDVRAQNKR